jgi:Domain of unknown function (DUF4337)
MADELSEIREQVERMEHDPKMGAVIVTLSILPVLVAAVTLLAHRAHTEEVLLQTRAADQWAYYNAKEIRRRNYELFLDEIDVFSIQDPKHAAEIKEKYAKEVERYREDVKEIQEKAKEADAELKVEEVRADRYDLAEVLLEVALVITSLTMMTKKKAFWLAGLVLSVCGIVMGAAAWMVH